MAGPPDAMGKSTLILATTGVLGGEWNLVIRSSICFGVSKAFVADTYCPERNLDAPIS